MIVTEPDTDTSLDTKRAAAPASTAFCTKSWPSTVAPSKAINRVPGATLRESAVISRISFLLGPVTEASFKRASKASKFFTRFTPIYIREAAISGCSFPVNNHTSGSRGPLALLLCCTQRHLAIQDPTLQWQSFESV